MTKLMGLFLQFLNSERMRERGMLKIKREESRYIYHTAKGRKIIFLRERWVRVPLRGLAGGKRDWHI